MISSQATLSIPPDSAAIREARRFAERFLRDHGAADIIDTVTLLVSELVTNAILHSGSGAELRVSMSDTEVRVEVRDKNASAPTVKHYSEMATTGRGMLIVESLAQEWGTEAQRDGKVVWFTITTPRAESGRFAFESSAVEASSPVAGAPRPRARALRRGNHLGRMELRLASVYL